MIKVVEGDLLQATENIIGHQTNTKGVWGSGLARQLREVYPESYQSYRLLCSRYGDKLLGTCQLNHDSNRHIIACLFGQTGYGRDKNIVYTQYNELGKSLVTLLSLAKKDGLSVALPWGLGSGLANGDWNVVYEIIDNVFKDYEVTLYRI